MKIKHFQEISKEFLKALIFMDFVLLSILSGIKVGVRLYSRIIHIMLLS